MQPNNGKYPGSTEENNLTPPHSAAKINFVFGSTEKQTITLPAIGSVEVSFSQSFCGTSSSLVFPTPVKVKKAMIYRKKKSLLKKNSTSEAPLSFFVTNYKPKV